MNREAMIQLGEYPKRMRLLVLVKELLTIRKYMKNTSDSDMMKLPKMTDNSKQAALTFARGLAIQGFYCDNTVEFLMGTVRALGITFKYGLSGYSSMSIIAYGLVRKTFRVFISFPFFYPISNPLSFISLHLLDPEYIERSCECTPRGKSC